MTHQRIKTAEIEISYCDCQEPIIQIIDHKRKTITPMSLKVFLNKFDRDFNYKTSDNKDRCFK